MTKTEERLQRIEKLILLSAKSVFSTEEAAIYVGKTPETINRWFRRGYLRHYTKNNQHWIKREDLDDYLTSEEVESNRDIERKADRYIIENRLRK